MSRRSLRGLCNALLGASLASSVPPCLASPEPAPTRQPVHDASAAPTPKRQWAVNAGYTAHALAAPGAHFGAEYRLARAAPFESNAALGFVFHTAANETAYALHARWGQRFTANFGLSFESALGLGIQYTQYQTPVFVFTDGVATSVSDSEARVGFTPHIAFGPGYDFERVSQLPLRIYARPGVGLVYPDLNSAFQAAVFAELGLCWTPRF